MVDSMVWMMAARWVGEMDDQTVAWMDVKTVELMAWKMAVRWVGWMVVVLAFLSVARLGSKRDWLMVESSVVLLVLILVEKMARLLA
jgi:hypothetical protein